MKILVTGGHSLRVTESVCPYIRADKTIVFQFSDPNYDPTSGSWKTGAAWYHYSDYPNVWEYYRNDTDWHSEFDSKFTSASNNVSVVEFKGTGIIDIRGMFSGCSALTSAANMVTPNATMASSLFWNCTSLTTAAVDMPSCTTYSYAFDGCSALSSVTVSNTGSATNMSHMFSGCTSLTAIPTVTTTGVTDVTSMFDGCINVASGALSKYTELSGMASVPTHTDCFKNCGSNTAGGQADLAQIPTDWGGTYVPVVYYDYYVELSSRAMNPLQIQVCAMTPAAESGVALVNGSLSPEALTAAQIAKVNNPDNSSSSNVLELAIRPLPDGYIRLHLQGTGSPSAVTWKSYQYWSMEGDMVVNIYDSNMTLLTSTYVSQRTNGSYTVSLT